jgi:hypothetical protein
MNKQEVERKIEAHIDRCTREINNNPTSSRENGGMYQALSTALLAMATLKKE